MPKTLFNRDELRNKIYGCWMGKSIGGTLGMPYEGSTDIHDIKGYTNVSGEPAPNDDLDLQLVWLKAVQDHGAKNVNNRLLGEYWLSYVPAQWNEYGICKGNMRAGLEPPISGEYHNEQWKHSNGAWIRTEIWACLAPGCPDVAIKYAYADGSVDHGNTGEGTFAAIFMAAMQSAAFVESDYSKLIEIGLSKIPTDCRVARSVKIVLDAYAKGKTWQQAREMVVQDSKDLGWFQAPGNIGFTILGLVYGEGDFGRSICLAANCGDDTDCTAGTLAATMGIVMGRDAIPAEWSEPVGDRIITIACDTASFQPAGTLTELTDQVMEQIPAFLIANKAPVELTSGPNDLSSLDKNALSRDHVSRELCSRPPFSVIYDFVHTSVMLDYGKEPEIRAGEPFELKVTLTSHFMDCRHVNLFWRLPEGWTVTPSNPTHATNWFCHFRDCQFNPVEVKVQITADKVGMDTRGVLEVRADARHTAGLVPIVFLAGS